MPVPIPDSGTSPPPLLRVRAQIGGEWKSFAFSETFRIGRTEQCAVHINDGHVSREHAEVFVQNQRWFIRDLGSANGIYRNGERTDNISLAGPGPVSVRLGVYGPFLELETESQAWVAPSERVATAKVREPLPSEGKSQALPDNNQSRSATHYFGNPADKNVGDHTRMVRRAFAEIQTKQKRKYGGLIAGLAACAVLAAAYGTYEHLQAQKQRNLAENLFYSMKSLDLDIAGVEKMVQASGSSTGAAEVAKYQNRRKDMEDSYNQFLATLHVYDPKMSEEDRLVLRVARIFGECEIDMPKDFLAEVKTYIKKWQGSGRFVRAVRLAAEKGYTDTITRELLAADLPAQFFYLAMQESDFDAYVSGPMTRKGIAKGMWQFIPETGMKYGLKIGPLLDVPRPDPGDDRHHWDRKTKAAAAYMKDLYSTDAQASGLLVMACYNWGEKSVLPLVRSMPANPKERNFWKLLSQYRDKIPQETYDYVFYIVSAAAIGENPRLFGIDCESPMAHLEHK